MDARRHPREPARDLSEGRRGQARSGGVRLRADASSHARLRREEVAQRANISPTWYTWLEQGRGGAPWADVLERIARALMLTDIEREHLFLLGLGRPPEARYRESEGVTPRLQRVLDAFDPSPALIRTAIWDVVAWNRGGDRHAGGLRVAAPRAAQHIALRSSRPALPGGAIRLGEAWRATCSAAFRVDAARAGAAAAVQPLVDELRRLSPELRADVARQRHSRPARRGRQAHPPSVRSARSLSSSPPSRSMAGPISPWSSTTRRRRRTPNGSSRCSYRAWWFGRTGAGVIASKAKQSRPKQRGGRLVWIASLSLAMTTDTEAPQSSAAVRRRIAKSRVPSPLRRVRRCACPSPRSSWPPPSWPAPSPSGRLARRFLLRGVLPLAAASAARQLLGLGDGLLCRHLALSSRPALALGEQLERLGERHRVRRRRLGDGRVDLAPVDVGAEPAGAQGHRSALGMLADRPAAGAAQRPGGERRQRFVERHRLGIGAARQGRVDLAVIDVGAEAAAADRHRPAERRVVAQRAAGIATPKRLLAPLSLAAMRSMARLAPMSNTSSSRPRLAWSCRAGHRRRSGRRRRESARRRSDGAPLRAAATAARSPFPA